MAFKIAVVQFLPVRKNPAKNAQTIHKALKDLQADLVVLPELSNSGYLFSGPEDLSPYSEPDDGKGHFLSSLIDLAKNINGAIITGYAQCDGNRIYNAAAALSPNGILVNYQKTHLYADEKSLFFPGETGFKTFQWKGITIGLMICFDWIFPESARTLTMKGAQIIAHPANLVMPYCQQAMITRAIENHVFTVTANRIGTETLGGHELHFTGQSQVTGPQGEVLWRGPEDESCVFVTEIEPEKANNKKISKRNHLINDRRPDHYLP
jgi:predicted amidohydrolase